LGGVGKIFVNFGLGDFFEKMKRVYEQYYNKNYNCLKDIKKEDRPGVDAQEALILEEFKKAFETGNLCTVFRRGYSYEYGKEQLHFEMALERMENVKLVKRRDSTSAKDVTYTVCYRK
jgi:hypothetical protein